MVETVVKGGAAGAGLVENYNLSAIQGCSDGRSLTLVHLCLCAEGVCAERCVVDLISDLDSFVEVGDRQNREEGTEALIAEQSIVDAVDLNNSGLDEEVFLVHGATNNDLAVLGDIEEQDVPSCESENKLTACSCYWCQGVPAASREVVGV